MNRMAVAAVALAAVVATIATLTAIHFWRDQELSAEAASVNLGPALTHIRAASLKSAGWSFVAQAKAQVAAQMRDPASAQFRGLGVTNGKALCGEVNGRNGFGAYSGFVPFYSDPRTGAVGVGETADARTIAAFSADYDRYCGGS